MSKEDIASRRRGMPRGASHQMQPRNRRRELSALLIAALTTSALSPAFGQSAVVSAPPVQPANSRTTLDVTPGGTPIVNIAAPDASGASHNIYTSLSVGKEGLIFNNSPVVGQTTIGGFILANPHLQRSGVASLILNEVTGGVRTTLAGPMEIFGPKAALVIANPTGITCDGCGFINMSRATLASGRLVFGVDGAFAGLAVDGGDVRVEGKGLLAGNVDYFDIVAGAAHINAELYARNLTIAGGAANFNYDARTASGLGAGSGGIAIDSTLLGGMYANRIRLIGTGDGVGVNMKGLVTALDGPLHITADATIGLGKVASAGDVTVMAVRGEIALHDQFYAGGAVNLAAGGSISQEAGFIGGAGDVTLTAGGGIATGGSGVYAGLASDGTLSGMGALHIAASSAIDTRRATLAAGRIDIAAGTTLDAGGVIASSGDAALKGDSIHLTATLGADGRLAIVGRTIAIDGAATGLAGASAKATESLAIESGGTLQSKGVMEASVSALVNAGTVVGGAGVNLTTDRIATSGTILSGEDVLLKNTGDAALGGIVEANGGARLKVGGDAVVTGRIAATGDMRIEAARLDHNGRLISGSDLELNATLITQAGVAEASGALTIAASKLALSGRTVGGKSVAIESGGTSFTDSSDLQSGGSLAIASGDDLATRGNVAALGVITLSTSGDLDQRAVIAGNDRIAMTATRDLFQAGSIKALGHISLAGDSIVNSGDIAGNASLALAAKTALISTGILGAVQRVDLVAPRLALGGTITSNDVLGLTAETVTLNGTASGIAGLDAHIDNLTIAASGALQSGISLDLSLARLVNQGLLAAAGSAHIAGSAVFINDGEIISRDSLALIAGRDLSLTGLAQASGDLAIDAAGTLRLGGTIYAGGNARLGAVHLDTAGVIAAKGALAIAVDDRAAFASTSTSYAGTTLALTSSYIATAGAIQSDGALTITASGDLMLSGQIESVGGTRLAAGNRASIKGTLASKGALALNASTAEITGAIIGQDGISISAINGDITLPGTISTVGDVRLVAQRRLTIGTPQGSTGTGDLGSGGTPVGSGSTASGSRSDSGPGSGNESEPGNGSRRGSDGKFLTPAIADGTEERAMLAPGSLSAVGKATLEAEEIRIFGRLASQGDLSLLASHILKVDGSAWSQSGLDASIGSLDIVATGMLGAEGPLAVRAVAGIVNAGNLASKSGGLDLELGGRFDNSGTVISGDTYRVASVADYSDTGTTQANAIDIAARDVMLGGLMAVDDRLDVSGRDITLSFGGDLQSGDALVLDAVGAASLHGRIVANGDAFLTSGVTLTVNGQASLSAARKLSLAAAGALTATSGSRMASGEAIDLSGGAIFLKGEALSNGVMAVNAVGQLSNSGALTALGELSLGGGALALGGSIATNGSLSIVDRAGPTIVHTGASLRGDFISVVAAGDVTNSGTLAAAGRLTTDIGGTLLNAATGTLQAGTTDDAGNVTATGDMRLAAVTAIDNRGLIRVTGALDIATPNFANSGTLVSASDIDLAAPSLSLGGTTISFGTVRAASTAGDLEITGGLEGKDVILAASGGGLLLGAKSHISAYGSSAQGLATLSSTGDIAALGIIAANNDGTLSAGGAIHIGADRALPDGTLVHALTSQANIVLTAERAIVNDGTIQAAHALKLSGASLASNNLLAGAALDFRTAGHIDFSGTVAAAGPIELASTGGNLSLGPRARAETAKAIRLSAAGALVNEGVILAGEVGVATPIGIIELSAGSTLVSNGAIVSNNADVSFHGRSVTLGGNFTAGRGTWAAGALVFDTADLDLAAGGEAIAGNELVFGGQRLTLAADSLLQSNDSMAITLGSASDAGHYSSAGQLVALGDLSLSIRGALDNRAGSGIFAGGSGDQRAGGHIIIDTARLDNAGVIAAHAAPGGAKGNVTITASTVANDGLIHADKALALDARSLTLAAPAGDNLGIVESGAAMNLSIPVIAIADGAMLRSGDAVTIVASRFASAGDVLAGGAIDIAASDSLGSSGTVATAGGINLSAGGNLNLSEMVSAGTTLAIKGADVTLAGTVQAWNAVDPAVNAMTVTATKAATVIDGALLSGGSLSIHTPAVLGLGDHALIYADGNVTSNADSITIARAAGSAPSIASNGKVNLASQNGFILDGAIVADGGVTLSDATSLELRITSLVSAGTAQAAPLVSQNNIALFAPAIAANGQITTTGTLGFGASTLAIGGAAIANGDISLDAWNGGAAPTIAIATSGTLTSHLGNANLGVLGGADIAGTLLASIADASFTAPGATIAATGKIAAGRDLRIGMSVDKKLVIDGNLLANRDMSLGGGTLVIGATGRVRAGQDFSFNTTDVGTGGGSIHVNDAAYDVSGASISAEIAGKIGAGRNLTLALPGTLIVHGSGEISAANDIAFTARHALIGARTNADAAGNPAALGVIAGRDFTLAATPIAAGLGASGLLLDGSIQAGRNLSINVSGDVTSSAVSQLVAGDTLSIAGLSFDLAGTNSAQSLVRIGTDIATGGTVRLAGATASNGRIEIRGGSTLVTAAGSLSVAGGAHNQTAIGRDIGALANIDIESFAAIVNEGAIWSDGVVFLKSPSGYIVNNAAGTNGGITGLRGIVIQPDGGSFVNSAGAFHSANTGLYLGRDFDNAGTFAPSGNYLISASNISNTGLLAASGNLTLHAPGNLVNTGTIFAGNNLAFKIGGPLTNGYEGDDLGNGKHGLILAANDISITANGVVNESAMIQSLGGDIRITLVGSDLANRIKKLVISEVPGTGAQHLVMEGPEEVSAIFANVSCGGSGFLGNGKKASFTCSPPNKVRVRYSGGGSATYDFLYRTEYRQNETVASTSTGTGTISAAGNFAIAGGWASITNSNSAILAGGNIDISTTGDVGNVADLLIKNVTSGGTTTLSNAMIPGAPTLIQAGGTVNIQAGSFNNIANNLVAADSYSTNQVRQNATPGTLSNRLPGTGSAPIVAGSAVASAGAVSGGGVTAPGGSAAAVGASGLAATAPGTGDLAVTSGGTRRTAGLVLGSPSLVATARSGLVGGSNGAEALAPIAIDAANKDDAIVTGFSLSLGSVDGLGLTGGDAAALARPFGAKGAESVLLTLGHGFAGTVLPALGGQDFVGFLGGFLQQFNLVDANGGFALAGGGSLFTYNDNPDTAYLFATNTGLSSEAALYDSSYFLGKFAPGRATTYTRLGDGFFEAMLIAREVQAVTGQAQLGTFGSVLDQYQGLLKNAADAQQSLGLQLGIGLTAAQISELTAPMLWHVSAKVAGRDVLVPVLYLSAADSKAFSAGALVAGDNVFVSAAGNIANSGKIDARTVAALTAGGNIVNASGGVIMGGSVVAKAANDILLGGGSRIAADGAGRYVRPDGTAVPGGIAQLAAGHDIVGTAIRTTATRTESNFVSPRNWSSSRSKTETVSGAAIGSTAGTTLSAGRDIGVDAADIASGGATTIVAGRDVTLGGAIATSQTRQAKQTGKHRLSSSASDESSFAGTTITSGGPVTIGSVDGKLSITGGSISTTNPGAGDISLYSGKGVDIAAGQSRVTTSKFDRLAKRKTVTTTTDSTTNDLASIDAAGSLGIVTPGAVDITGGNLAAAKALDVDAATIAISGVIDSSSYTQDSVTKKKKLFSSKKTVTHREGTDQSVIASTLSGDKVNFTSTGDTSILGSNAAASNGVAIAAGGDLRIGAMAATDSERSSVKVKKSGISLSSNGLFAGVAKSAAENEVTGVTHKGSLIGATSGDVTLDAGKALTVTGSQVVSTATTTISGESATILNATDSVDTSSSSKSSSFGVTIKPYENVSGAVNSVAGLPGRISDGAAGGAAQTGITAASEVVRSVSAVMGALTNTAGVAASLGFSKSKSASETHSNIVSGSGIVGNEVVVIADRDVTVRGSSVTATSDLAVVAGRDILLESAQNSFESQVKNSSSVAGIGVNVGVGVGGGSASASVSASSSKSRGNSEAATQSNSALVAGENLSLAAGRDIALSGVVAEGRDVSINARRDLTLESIQDVRSRNSSGSGISLGITYSPTPGTSGIGGNGSVSISNGKGSSSSVAEQSAIIARGGELNADVAGTTTVRGGVIAALDENGQDTGRLSLSTGRLQVSDIADSARSRDISVGVSVSINDPFERGIEGANTPVLDGSYTGSKFAQDTKGTIGQGRIAVADPAVSTPLAGINRDVEAAQVVTKDSRSGFTVYADEAAIRETIALASGDARNSVIIRSGEKLAHDPLVIIKSAIAEAKTLADGITKSGHLETLLGELPGLFGIKPAPTLAEAQISFERIVEQRYEAAVEIFEKEMGRPATGPEKGRFRNLAKGVAGAMLGIDNHGMANVDAMSQDGRPTSETALINPNGDLLVKGDWDNLSTGDKILGVANDAALMINSVDPAKRDAMEKTVDVLTGGPVKALGGWVIEYGIQKAAEANPAVVEHFAEWANEAGVWAIDKLSADDEKTTRQNDAFDRQDIREGDKDTTSIDNILTTASLIFGVDIPGFGKGKSPKVNLPDVDTPKAPDIPNEVSKANSADGEAGSDRIAKSATDKVGVTEDTAGTAAKTGETAPDSPSNNRALRDVKPDCLFTPASCRGADGKWTHWTNPETGKVEPIETAKNYDTKFRVEDDHIFPVAEIKKMLRAAGIAEDSTEAKKLLELEENFQPLPKPLNCSKGCRLGLDWKELKSQGIKIDPAYSAALKKRQDEVKKKISDTIDHIQSEKKKGGKL